MKKEPLDGTDRITETTVTDIGGDAGFRPGRLRRRGQLCRAIGRDPTEGSGPPKKISLLCPQRLPSLLQSLRTAKVCQLLTP